MPRMQPIDFSVTHTTGSKTSATRPPLRSAAVDEEPKLKRLSSTSTQTRRQSVELQEAHEVDLQIKTGSLAKSPKDIPRPRSLSDETIDPIEDEYTELYTHLRGRVNTLRQGLLYPGTSKGEKGNMKLVASLMRSHEPLSSVEVRVESDMLRMQMLREFNAENVHFLDELYYLTETPPERPTPFGQHIPNLDFDHRLQDIYSQYIDDHPDNPTEVNISSEVRKKLKGHYQALESALENYKSLPSEANRRVLDLARLDVLSGLKEAQEEIQQVIAKDVVRRYKAEKASNHLSEVLEFNLNKDFFLSHKKKKAEIQSMGGKERIEEIQSQGLTFESKRRSYHSDIAKEQQAKLFKYAELRQDFNSLLSQFHFQNQRS